MKKNRWNNDLPAWLNEDYYTKDEIEERLGDIETNLNELELTITYVDTTTETKIFYVKEANNNG